MATALKLVQVRNVEPGSDGFLKDLPSMGGIPWKATSQFPPVLITQALLDGKGRESRRRNCRAFPCKTSTSL